MLSRFTSWDGFDSILVRLKAKRVWDEITEGLSFDSILVRLKGKFVSPRPARQRFDSILVRLKASSMPQEVGNSRRFRFHTGSIKSFFSDFTW